MMDSVLLRERAGVLKKLLDQYAKTDKEVAGLRFSLSWLLLKVRLGIVATPMDWRQIPGSLSFSEGTLQKYRDLEDAYAKFKIEITGGETEVLRNLKQKHPEKD